MRNDTIEEARRALPVLRSPFTPPADAESLVNNLLELAYRDGKIDGIQEQADRTDATLKGLQEKLAQHDADLLRKARSE